jgi:lipopolysaccharide export system ATP-binding protein
MSQGIRRSGWLNFFSLLRQGHAPKRKAPNGRWQGADRGVERGLDNRGLERGLERGPDRRMERNPDPGTDWGADQSGYQVGHQGGYQGDYQDPDRDFHRGFDPSLDQGADRTFDQPVDLDAVNAPMPVARTEARETREPRETKETRDPREARKRARPRRDQPLRREAAQGYLAAHGLEKSYGARRVVNGVSLYVRRGEAVGLLGPNGAGKTTAFYTITGLIKPEAGTIELDGYDVTHLPMYQRARLGIGYLPQEASIFRGLNVEENIRAVLEVVEPDRRKRDQDLNALLDEFEITARRKTPTIALSGGERRRVEIARALASRPNYMLLDEPFAGIDPKAVVEIQRLVRRLTQRGIGVLITDHNVRETLDLTDRSYIIYSGEVLMEGRKDDIVNDPQVRQLYLGEDFRI